jgi:ATP-dependent DNA helicase Rep
MKSNFSLFDDTDQVALLKELTEGLIEDDKVVLQQLISTISNWKNDLKTPAQAAAARKANGIASSPTAMGCTMRI